MTIYFQVHIQQLSQDRESEKLSDSSVNLTYHPFCELGISTLVPSYFDNLPNLKWY